MLEHLTIQESAEALNCSEITVRRLVSRGELPAYRLGKSRVIRIKRRDIDKLLRPVTSLAGDAA